MQEMPVPNAIANMIRTPERTFCPIGDWTKAMPMGIGKNIATLIR